ncbi:ABC transporter substrate-binding protein [Denitratisoma oestradiolicum]|uniref:Periplasmic binding protein n=1 Tax=Denitratisoma oestradiolicum TaxID=311182 RepID=A0A6S6XUW1_9PROT|nr:ABC transporter substrate-binding protein [Denitratisoma oestradiolicum]TWO81131.1 cobalamin-binding protein [Denitratisoma oestradiolicum]CAB1367817.1 Periplasmic binding protein [Denitratisoma oestradiolicum]
MSGSDRLPQRIACLSSETVEVLYDLGQADRIAGISGFTMRPTRARKEKPKISGFSSMQVERVLAVHPDLVLAFSDLQADMCRNLIEAGLTVHVFNQRSVEGILDMVDTLGRLVGAQDRAAALIDTLESTLAAARRAAQARGGRRPRVYFEEWDEPPICGIRWVSELIEIAGGEDIFAERAHAPGARERILADPLEVAVRQPDIIIGSWCGKHFRPERVQARPGWSDIPAIRQGQVHEIKSPLILTPGPAAIREGLPTLVKLFDDWARH